MAATHPQSNIVTNQITEYVFLTQKTTLKQNLFIQQAKVDRSQLRLCKRNQNNSLVYEKDENMELNYSGDVL